MIPSITIAVSTSTPERADVVVTVITFDPEKEGPQIANALNFFQYQLKGISFLPKTEIGAYKQMPYEEITETDYRKMLESLDTLSFRSVKGSKAVVERFCNNDTCELEFETEDAESSEVQV